MGMDGILPRINRGETVEIRVYQVLRQAILEGRLPGGRHLVQEDVAREMGVSRIPVRDALRRLATDGLVTPGSRGTYHVNPFTAKDAEDIYELRALIEGFAAEQATQRAEQHDIEILEQTAKSIAEAAEHGDTDTYVQSNVEFHMSLYRLADNPRMLSMIRSLWLGRPPLTPIAFPAYVRRSAAEHMEMVAALRQRDGARLRQLVVRHITSSKNELVRRLYADDSDRVTTALEQLERARKAGD